MASPSSRSSTSSPLDELYGKGARKALLAVYRQPEALEETPIHNGVRFEVSWEDGSRMKCDCYRDLVHIGWLESKTPGTYSWLAEDTPAVYKKLGVKRFTAAEGGPDAAALRKRGDWQGEGRLISWEL